MTYAAATGGGGSGGSGGSGGCGCDQRRPEQSVLLQLLQQIHFGGGGGCGRTGRGVATLRRRAFIDTLMGIVIERGTRIGRHRGLGWIDTRVFRQMTVVVVMVLDGVVMLVVMVMMGHIGWMQFMGKYR